MVGGSCLCGDIVYEIEGQFQYMAHCHCSMCRKIHGSAFATYVGAPTEGFRWVSGEDRMTKYPSSPGFERAFCSTCGSVVPSPDEKTQLSFVPAGNLEEDCVVRPEAHIFVASKAPWYTITDNLPQFDEYPPGMDMETVSLSDRSGKKEGAVSGSCLCGAVAFEYEGAPKFMMNCHCSRCRRVKGAAHASNVFVDPATFRWTKGENEVVSYKLPEAERFGNAFCRICGSSVPRHAAGAPAVNVPAGSLDDAPGVAPRAHIYIGSKASWFEPTDDVPCFEEMPPPP